MKSALLAAVTCVVILFCSCQKENVAGSVLNSTTTDTSLNASARWPFGHGQGNGGGQSDQEVTFQKKSWIMYGAMICPPLTATATWNDFQLSVADQLGISCLRAVTYVPSEWSVANLLNSAYKVVLNFNSAPGNGPIPFVANLSQYQVDLRNILNSYTIKPAVAVIENEESNRFYYSGSAQEYINQLKAAISVMHAYGVKVANGGITNQGLNYLVYQDFLNQGKNDSAKMFQQLTFVTPNSPTTQERGAFVDELLDAYTQMSLDYINFHWKGTSPDTEALKEVINYLKKRTGKSLISNELGQLDDDPNTLLTHIQQCTDQNFPYILWYSPDEGAGKKATSLQHSDGSLTASGGAYQGYLAN